MVNEHFPNSNSLGTSHELQSLLRETQAKENTQCQPVAGQEYSYEVSQMDAGLEGTHPLRLLDLVV